MPKALPLLVDASPICCDPLGMVPLTEGNAIELAVRLKALADPVRLRLVDHLVRTPEATTSELAPLVGLGEPTTNHHLKQLFQAGLVAKRRAGAAVLYSLDRDAIAALIDVLGCCR
ncbi:metalloregulator ArsR/SmtB family transcription factor [Granulicoccus sp. GXG6511]|uniref:metalloregulator ArsR/SmtB family transcription factor n=1 Tax=Granulicoccus sp. GXG6511 TaxID=3381351 RepID=UPI003D7D41AA